MPSRPLPVPLLSSNTLTVVPSELYSVSVESRESAPGFCRPPVSTYAEINEVQ